LNFFLPHAHVRQSKKRYEATAEATTRAAAMTSTAQIVLAPALEGGADPNSSSGSSSSSSGGGGDGGGWAAAVTAASRARVLGACDGHACELTGALLAGLVSRPRPTAELLARPPFRFLHAVGLAARNATGFGGGSLFPRDRADPGPDPKTMERDARLAWCGALVAAVDGALLLDGALVDQVRGEGRGVGRKGEGYHSNRGWSECRAHGTGSAAEVPFTCRHVLALSLLPSGGPRPGGELV